MSSLSSRSFAIKYTNNPSESKTITTIFHDERTGKFRESSSLHDDNG